MRSGHTGRSTSVALCGILAAAALVLMFAADLIPSGWVGVTAVAGVAVAVAVAAAGYAYAILCYLAAGILALVLLPLKRVALVFLCMFGLYPIVKSLIEKCKNRILEYFCKLVFFNAVFLLLYLLAFTLLFESVFSAWSSSIPLLPLLWAAGNIIFLLYDYAFTKIMGMLQQRLIPNLRHTFAAH